MFSLAPTLVVFPLTRNLNWRVFFFCAKSSLVESEASYSVERSQTLAQLLSLVHEMFPSFPRFLRRPGSKVFRSSAVDYPPRRVGSQTRNCCYSAPTQPVHHALVRNDGIYPQKDEGCTNDGQP